MSRKMIIMLLAIIILLPGLAGAASEKDFEVQTTENLINLCTASPDDPLYHQAVNFCHGYLVGAFHYYEATSMGPAGVKLVCPPDPQPSRNEKFWGRRSGRQGCNPAGESPAVAAGKAAVQQVKVLSCQLLVSDT